MYWKPMHGARCNARENGRRRCEMLGPPTRLPTATAHSNVTVNHSTWSTRGGCVIRDVRDSYSSPVTPIMRGDACLRVSEWLAGQTAGQCCHADRRVVCVCMYR
eukprot:GHVU01194566.1.p3 GENE.GHVU01194566.1~~GHVU01194566.1.p3  ORF type:complete len:104 (-),score=0.51 GHVU01194566.1:653-964(-)